MLQRIIYIIILSCSSTFFAQNYLSNLSATKDDPIYTNYAAPISRSEYKTDQAYQMMWFDQERGIDFVSSDGGELCLAFKVGNEIRYKLGQFYKEPIITASYSDLVKLHYYPFEGVNVEVVFNVYSSRVAIENIKITNESKNIIDLSLLPFFQLTTSPLIEPQYLLSENAFVFKHNKKRDGWMQEHNIPLSENLKSVYMIDDKPVSWGGYSTMETVKKNDLPGMLKDIISGGLNNMENITSSKILAFESKYKLNAGESASLRIVRGMDLSSKEIGELVLESKSCMDKDLNSIILDDEKYYEKIPRIVFKDKDDEMLYWNAFTLIRQCMMPPENECNYNYYVFSREPKWGWGYGGQVFHESLVMLAYAYMDPVGAMNSQRVYMERQREDGYINYRTGPYLNETIEHEGQYTSSAPWYNYQNYEIYKITKDKKFLKEAYESGKKFYNYYINNRDSDNDGLCEWGAHAVLECVRDARVAVWDRVGWPSNFEGMDLNVMLVNEAKALCSMSEELGLSDESKKWNTDAQTRTELINKTFWDSETNFYYQVDKNDDDFTYKNTNDLKIKEIIGFLPLWANVATPERAELLLKQMKDPDEFWRPYGVPTLSAKDPYYNPMGYWNGPVWVQWQYLLLRGLLDYKYNIEAKELVNKVLDNVIHQLKTDHYFWEFYSPDDYQAGWNKTYIWTGIVARMLIDLNNAK
ncbi:MAG: hypothetical protein CVV25_08595 [Ignavibacteriae bacterium HGW-Ignavibacteriae-4]|jgi:hypothetical protein|nr:MAG: hypothetical protein CVV25_08595 [Ignavibacteriae bacterium HGW-Ignavibacteriae-4]